MKNKDKKLLLKARKLLEKAQDTWNNSDICPGERYSDDPPGYPPYPNLHTLNRIAKDLYYELGLLLEEKP